MNIKEKIYNLLLDERRINYATYDDIKKFLRSQGISVSNKLKKPELNNLFEENFSLDNFEEFCKAPRFGLMTKDIEELLQVGKVTIRNLRKAGMIHRKATVKNYGEGVTYIYDVQDVIDLIESDDCPKPTKKKTVMPELTDANIAEALYLINKSAKKSRDTKRESYENRKPAVTQAAKTREYNLYALKDAVMNKLLEEGKMQLIGHHEQGNMLLACFAFEGFTFHLPYSYGDDIEIIGTIDDLISAEKDMGRIHLNFDEAMALLVDYTNFVKPERIRKKKNDIWDDFYSY